MLRLTVHGEVGRNFGQSGSQKGEERLRSWWQLKAPRTALLMAKGVVAVDRCEWWVLYHDSGKWRFRERRVRRRCARVSRADLYGVFTTVGRPCLSCCVHGGRLPSGRNNVSLWYQKHMNKFNTHICPTSYLRMLVLKRAVLRTYNTNWLGIGRILSLVALICQNSHQILT